MINKSLISKKFNADGSFRSFEGNTIISFFAEDTVLIKICKAIQKCFKTEFNNTELVFLPSESFHITIIELLCDQERRKDYWSSKISSHTPIKETTKLIKEMLENIEFDLVVRLQLKEVLTDNVVRILLEVPFLEDKMRIKTFRDYIAEKTGVRLPGHENYQFHISLAYITNELSAEKVHQLQLCKQKGDEIIKCNESNLRIEKPFLAEYYDMHTFKKVL